MFAAPGYSQTTRFNLNINNKTLESVFNEIEKNSEFSVILKSSEVNLKERVSVQVHQQTVGTILNQVLKIKDYNTRLKISILLFTNRKIIILLISRQKGNYRYGCR